MKKFKVTAKREIFYEKIVEAESEDDAIQVFYETKDDDDIDVDTGSEVYEVEETEEDEHQ
jgi:hypothetical protein